MENSAPHLIVEAATQDLMWQQCIPRLLRTLTFLHGGLDHMDTHVPRAPYLLAHAAQRLRAQVRVLRLIGPSTATLTCQSPLIRRYSEGTPLALHCTEPTANLMFHRTWREAGILRAAFPAPKNLECGGRTYLLVCLNKGTRRHCAAVKTLVSIGLGR